MKGTAQMVLVALLGLFALAPFLMAGPPGKDLTEPAHDSVETSQAHPDRTDGGNGFVCGRDAGSDPSDAGPVRRRLNPTPVPCPSGTKAIRVKSVAGADGGIGLGGSRVRCDSTPVVLGPGESYTSNRETEFCVPCNGLYTRPLFMCQF